MAGLAGMAGAAASATPMGMAAGALKSLTGGSAGPSSAKSKSAFDLDNKASSGFRGGDLNMGSPRGIPTYYLLIAIIAVALFFLMSK